MLSKYIIQCGMITLLTLIGATSLYIFSGDIANFITTHHYVKDSSSVFLNSDGELDIFISTVFPFLAGCAALIIGLIATLQTESKSGIHFTILENNLHSKKELNKTAKNFLIIMKTQYLCLILFILLSTLSAFPFTPLFQIDTLFVLICGLIVILGHGCIAKKYSAFLLSNTNNKELEDKLVENFASGFLDIENNTLFYCIKKKNGSTTTKEKLAIIADEKFTRA